jgi:hypothetical protein
MRRLDELASVFEDTVGAKDNGLQKIAADLKATIDRPKYQELLERAQDVGPGVNAESFVDRAGSTAQERAHSEVDWDVIKEAGARKRTQMSRKKIIKDINNSRDRYHAQRSRLSELKKERDRLNAMIQSAEDGETNSKKRMLLMSDILRNLDLTNSPYALMYENDRQDVSYLMDKEEFHVKIDEDGEVKVTPWRDYMRELRSSLKEGDEELEATDEDEAYADVPPSLSPQLLDSADLDIIPGSARIEGPDPRSEDETLTGYPNESRFAG